jgi:chromosome partitioning protein
VLEILPEYNIPLLNTRLRQRQAYRASAVYGGTVHNIGSKAAPAIAEVDAHTDEISVLIGLPGTRKKRRAS